MVWPHISTIRTRNGRRNGGCVVVAIDDEVDCEVDKVWTNEKGEGTR